MRNIPEVKQNTYDIFTPHLHSAGAHAESMKIVSFTYPVLTSTMVRSTLFYFWIVNTPPHQNLSYTSLKSTLLGVFWGTKIATAKLAISTSQINLSFPPRFACEIIRAILLGKLPKTHQTDHARNLSDCTRTGYIKISVQFLCS